MDAVETVTQSALKAPPVHNSLKKPKRALIFFLLSHPTFSPPASLLNLPRQYSHNIHHCNCFKLDNPVAFTPNVVRPSPLSSSRTLLHLKRKPCAHLSSLSPSPSSPQLLATMNLLFVPMSLPILKISCKLNGLICSPYIQLPWHTIIFLRFIHVTAHTSSSFLLMT